MADVTARVTVKGVDLREMMTMAREQLSDLTDARWDITEIELWGQEDMASREGMARLWTASMTMKVNVQE